MRSPLPALLFVIVLVACAPYQSIESGPVRVGNMSLTTPEAWAQIDLTYYRVKGPTAIWTRDGLPLNQVLLYAAIEDGDPLFEIRSKDRPFGAFSSAMLEAEIHELVVDSVARYYDAGPVTTARVGPLLFAGAAGFESEFAFSSKVTELDYRALAAGAVIEKRLYLLIYVAPRLHYFEAQAGAFRQMVASAALWRA